MLVRDKKASDSMVSEKMLHLNMGMMAARTR